MTALKPGGTSEKQVKQLNRYYYGIDEKDCDARRRI